MRTKRVNMIAKQTEELYNRYQVWVMDLDTTDFQLKRLHDLYKQCLDELYADGIGGVSINGIFRSTNTSNWRD